jgi:lincosamide nucleotidyltransferase A/C/D/E
MPAGDVLNLYDRLSRAGVVVWIDGGWGVDALLGRQLRSHQDLDVAVAWRDVPALRATLRAEGYTEVRSESQWNFVLSNGRLEVDVHAFVHDDRGELLDGVGYPAASLTGSGTIDGHGVRCISAPYMLEFIAPWIAKWPQKYVPAVRALCEKFNLELPPLRGSGLP